MYMYVKSGGLLRRAKYHKSMPLRKTNQKFYVFPSLFCLFFPIPERKFVCVISGFETLAKTIFNDIFIIAHKLIHTHSYISFMFRARNTQITFLRWLLYPIFPDKEWVYYIFLIFLHLSVFVEQKCTFQSGGLLKIPLCVKDAQIEVIDLATSFEIAKFFRIIFLFLFYSPNSQAQYVLLFKYRHYPTLKGQNGSFLTWICDYNLHNAWIRGYIPAYEFPFPQNFALKVCSFCPVS